MSRLHPRQRLLGEAVAVGLAAVAALGLALWWLATPPAIDAVGGPAVATRKPVAAGPPPPPAGQLWRPATDAPVAVAPPAPAPTFHLITLSQRQGAWTALVDPGNGAPTERVHAGDTISGWQVSRIDGDGLELTAGTQHHRLQLGP